MYNRIIQELVSNSVKYSKGNTIDVKLKQKENELQIAYADNGSGYEPSEVEAGMGLQNIRVRTEFLKGKLTDNSARDTGVSYLFTIPL